MADRRACGQDHFQVGWTADRPADRWRDCYLAGRQFDTVGMRVEDWKQTAALASRRWLLSTQLIGGRQETGTVEEFQLLTLSYLFLISYHNFTSYHKFGNYHKLSSRSGKLPLKSYQQTEVLKGTVAHHISFAQMRHGWTCLGHYIRRWTSEIFRKLFLIFFWPFEVPK
jgi:hypothetical protein